MVSRGTLDPVGATWEIHGLRASGGNRIRASLLNGSHGGNNRFGGFAQAAPQGGVA